MTTFVTPTPAQQIQMDAAVSQAQSDLDLYKSMVLTQGSGAGSGVWGMLKADLNNYASALHIVDSAGQDANLANVDRLQARFDDWSNRQYRQVLEGSQSLEGWSATGKAIHDDAAYNTNGVKDWTFTGISEQAAVATGNEVEADAKAAAAKIAEVGFPIWAMAVVVLILILAIKVA